MLLAVLQSYSILVFDFNSVSHTASDLGCFSIQEQDYLSQTALTFHPQINNYHYPHFPQVSERETTVSVYMGHTSLLHLHLGSTTYFPYPFIPHIPNYLSKAPICPAKSGPVTQVPIFRGFPICSKAF